MPFSKLTGRLICNGPRSNQRKLRRIAFVFEMRFGGLDSDIPPSPSTTPALPHPLDFHRMDGQEITIRSSAVSLSASGHADQMRFIQW